VEVVDLCKEKQFFIPIEWVVRSSVLVEASSLDEAIQLLKENFEFYIPDIYEHDFDSVQVDESGCYEYK